MAAEEGEVVFIPYGVRYVKRVPRQVKPKKGRGKKAYEITPPEEGEIDVEDIEIEPAEAEEGEEVEQEYGEVEEGGGEAEGEPLGGEADEVLEEGEGKGPQKTLTNKEMDKLLKELLDPLEKGEKKGKGLEEEEELEEDEEREEGEGEEELEEGEELDEPVEEAPKKPVRGREKGIAYVEKDVPLYTSHIFVELSKRFGLPLAKTSFIEVEVVDQLFEVDVIHQGVMKMRRGPNGTLVPYQDPSRTVKIVPLMVKKPQVIEESRGRGGG